MKGSNNYILPRLFCSFCGAEIADGSQYWYINGFVLCEDCLPDFARADYRSCLCIHGEEGIL